MNPEGFVNSSAGLLQGVVAPVVRFHGHGLLLSASRPCCSIRIVWVHLLVAEGFRAALAVGQLLLELFLDREEQITPQPHHVPHAEALAKASNQQIPLGSQAARGSPEEPDPGALIASGIRSCVKRKL